MAEPKTKVNKASVEDFFRGIKDTQVRKDCQTIANMMQKAAKAPPEMWGASIVGFGRHTQVYANGKEAEWMLIGFAPRKQNIALYLMMGNLQEQESMLAKLGPHDHGKGCLYIKRLTDVHLPTLDKIVRAAVRKRAGSNSGISSWKKD
jgi:hypothetical protein